MGNSELIFNICKPIVFVILCFSVELHCAALMLVSQLVVQLVNSDVKVKTKWRLLAALAPWPTMTTLNI